MQLGVPDPRDSLRTQQEIMKDKSSTIDLLQMTIIQLLNFIKNAKDEKDRKSRDKALKILMARILSGIKNICSKGVSAGDASKISALGNGMDSAGDTAKDASAGDTAKSSAK